MHLDMGDQPRLLVSGGNAAGCRMSPPALALHEFSAALEEIARIFDDLLAAIIEFFAAIHQLSAARFHCLSAVLCGGAEVLPGVFPGFRGQKQGSARANHSPSQKPAEITILFHVVILISILMGGTPATVS
jgi:hypothetical protein